MIKKNVKYCQILDFEGILVCRQFRVLESKGIHTPKHCQSMSKIYEICSLGMVDSICGEGDVGQSKSKRTKRATYLSDRINQYNDLARAEKDIRKWLTRGAVAH